MSVTITLGDFVTVTSHSFDGAGRVIAFDGGLFAVEHDDDNEVTWHMLDELESE